MLERLNEEIKRRTREPRINAGAIKLEKPADGL
jgi:hypothetical protein